MAALLQKFRTLPLLTPGEALVLLNGRQVIFKELLKLTLTDLLMKKILTLKPVAGGSLYVCRGEAYGGYHPLAHEEITPVIFRVSLIGKFFLLIWFKWHVGRQAALAICVARL